MTTQRDVSKPVLYSLVAISAALLLASLFAKLAAGFKTGPVINALCDWLQTMVTAEVLIESLRRYGAYGLANIELIAISFLLIPPLRRLGAGLGLLFAVFSLLILLLVSLHSHLSLQLIPYIIRKLVFFESLKMPIHDEGVPMLNIIARFF